MALKQQIIDRLSEEIDADRKTINRITTLLRELLVDGDQREEKRGDGVAITKQRRKDLHHDSVRNPATVAGRGRLKEDLESSTWRRRQDFKATRTIDQLAGGKICDRNAKESWALLKDLALYDNESWNDPRDFTKPVKAISLPQDVLSTSDRHLIELKNQVQRLMEALLAPMQPTQVNKITSSCEICSGPHDTQYCMENPEQAFVEYASSRIDEVGAGALPSDTVKNPKLNINSTTLVLSARSYQWKTPNVHPKSMVLSMSSQYVPSNQTNLKVHKLNSFLESSGLVPQSSHTKIVCMKGDDGDVIFIEMIRKNNYSREEGPKYEGSATIEGLEVEYFDTFPTRSELAYHRTDEITYKMPHKIEQYNSLSDLEKEHTKSVYLINEKDKRRRVEYVMSKILGFYKECLELRPGYLDEVADDEEVV
ncbi:hypothetical protein Tco_0453304 [Tanacetum coccineum]